MYEKFETYFKTFLKKTENITSYMGGDLNLNLPDHSTNEKVQDCFNFIFQKFFASVINLPTRVIKNNATLFVHILINAFVNTKSSTGIGKSDLSDHFPIFVLKSEQKIDSSKNIVTMKIIEIDKTSKRCFKEF